MNYDRIGEHDFHKYFFKLILICRHFLVMPSAKILLLLAFLLTGFKKGLALTDDDYRRLNDERVKNCYDCFDQFAHLCTTLYDRCETYLRSADGGQRDKAERDARGLMTILNDTSKLKSSVMDSGYCLYFQIVSTDKHDFCQLDHGDSEVMTANYIAMMVAQDIRDQLDVRDVDTLMVHFQKDEKPFRKYMRMLLKKLQSDSSGRRVIVGNTISSEKMNLNLEGIDHAGKSTYRVWVVYNPNTTNQISKAKMRAIKVAVARAAKRFGKGVYLSKGAKVVRKKKFFVVTLMSCLFC